MSRRNSEVPGNAMASAALFAKEMVRAGESLYQMEYTLDTLFDKEVVVTSIRIRTPGLTQEGYLVVVNALVLGDAVVGFHGDTTFGKAVIGVIERLRNGTIKWKPDEYAS